MRGYTTHSSTLPHRALGAVLAVALTLSAGAADGWRPPVEAAGMPACLARTQPPRCYTPQQLRTAYAFQPLLDRGITGRGRTVVIIDAPPSRAMDRAGQSSNIRADVALYDRLFGLPDPVLHIVAPFTPSTDTASPEEALDVETVHAIAPDATITVILADPQAESGQAARVMAFLDAARYAIDHNLGDVISISLGQGEHCFGLATVRAAHQTLRAAWAAHVTVVASSGDFGVVGKPCSGPGGPLMEEVDLPAADTLVTAAGGTELDAAVGTGAYIGETAWHERAGVSTSTGGSAGWGVLGGASGGGVSRYFRRPRYQDGLAGIADRRAIPDVAADAATVTGALIALDQQGMAVVKPGGGTSAAAPLWAALTALADQQAGRRLGFLNTALYRIGRGPSAGEAFHDITAGTNTVRLADPAGRIATIQGYAAAPGWDAVTGWGSPQAAALVPLLIQAVRPGDGSGL